MANGVANDQVANAAGAIVSAGAAGWFAQAGEIAVQLLGVPLPVVLAAIAGAFLARTYQEPCSYISALGRSFGWVVFGCAGAQAAVAITSTASETFKVPVGALAFIALLISGLAPKLWPVLVEQAPIVLRRVLRLVGGSSAKP